MLKSVVDAHGALSHRLSSAELQEFFVICRFNLSPRWKVMEERVRRGTGVPVDLGLSVLWSSRNVGAVSGEQPGLYVGWGDVHGNKMSMDVDDYPSSTPPCLLDVLTQDIARERWAESWRLPTRAEAQELIDKCQWIWTVVNGVPGFQVLGKTGNSIFLPAVGIRYGYEYEDSYYCGYLWTSSLNIDDITRAYIIEYSQGDVAVSAMSRHCGLNIRPILEKTNQ